MAGWFVERLRGFRSVSYWLGRLGERTGVVNLYTFANFMRWLGEHGGSFASMSPDDLVEWQRGHPGSYELLDLVQGWVRGMDVRANTKARRYGVIRSFFAHNRAELPRDPGFIIRSEIPPVVGKLTVDELRRIVETSNTMYRALFLCMFQSGMGARELLYWNQTGLDSLLKQLREGRHPIRIDLPGRKRNRNIKPYYTFIGLDAIEALERWLEVRPRTQLKHIFLTQFKTPLSRPPIHIYWIKRLYRLGLAEPGRSRGHRTGKNLHEMRDLFKSRWRLSGCDPEVCEFFLGHDIDRLGYDKSPWLYPEWFEEQYCRAERWLNILSEDPEKVSVHEFNKVMRELMGARKALKEIEWLLGDPEAKELLRRIIEEKRNQRSSF